jgi:hypothetical protein
MRGQPENPLDVGIGKKVERPTAPTEPATKRVDGKPYHYETNGKRSYRPPVPDCPQHVTPWDIWREYLRKQEQGVDFQIFYPLG